MTVLVVDDDPAVRRSVARLVRSAGFTARTFSSPVDFLHQPLPTGPSCVVLDMNMDDMNGLEVQEALGKSDRQIPVVFLSGHGTIPTATASIKHGAEEFLEKPMQPRQLLDAVSRAVEHDRAHASERAAQDELRRRLETLTPREQEVMTFVVSGSLNKQTAAELGTSEKTIKVHRARVMEKMQVESLAELVLLAERLGVTGAFPPAAAAAV